jgi:DNA-binding LacI/PurR family transcriptional regulator
MAGVTKPTASVILNNRPTIITVSEKTRKRIFDAAEKLGYQPDASARALVTGRTGNIGFILSDRVTDGLANEFFARQLCGIERACSRLGYGLKISVYNLSDIDSFVLPPKVGQRSIDGVVLSGYARAEIVKRFKTYGIACICTGDNVETAGLVPTVSVDIVHAFGLAVKHAAELGHRLIGVTMGVTRREHEVIDLVERQMSADETTRECKLVRIHLPGRECDYATAKMLMKSWLELEDSQRPSLLITTDQACVAMMSELASLNKRCPEDLSLIGTCDSRVAQYASTPLTALAHPLVKIGEIAAELLINHLENKKPLGDNSVNNLSCELVKRKSCSRIEVASQ